MTTDQPSEEQFRLLHDRLTKLEEHCIWADGEIERLRAVVRKYEDDALKRPAPWTVHARNDFTIDRVVEDDAPTSALFVMRGERSVLLEVRAFANDDRQIIRYENSITYSVATPSLERFRVGFRGELANDSSERVVPNATVEDLIASLQWIVGKPSPTKENP